MTPLECHGTFANMEPHEARALLPEGLEIDESNVDPIPALLTAGAMLSGRLGDAHSVDDLRDAAAHFRTLISAGVVSVGEWKRETCEVIDELLRWGDRLSASAQAN